MFMFEDDIQVPNLYSSQWGRLGKIFPCGLKVTWATILYSVRNNQSTIIVESKWLYFPRMFLSCRLGKLGHIISQRAFQS